LAVAADRLVTVAVDSTVTPDLRAEGLAREAVRRIQAMRKDAGFDISDRITTFYQATGEFSQVFQKWEGYIKAETLSTELIAGEAPAGAYSETHNIEGQELKLAVKQN
jgi:isoleucyl-tRNA synthetase